MSIATPEQVGAITGAVEARYRALVLTAAHAGCRRGELVGLRRTNLDLSAGTLAVVEQVVELRIGQLLTCEPNSASGRRVVHLPAGLITELETHVARFVEPGPDALVFTSRTGGVLRQSYFRNRHWFPARRAVGIEKLRFHDYADVLVMPTSARRPLPCALIAATRSA